MGGDLAKWGVGEGEGARDGGEVMGHGRSQEFFVAG